MSEHIVIEYTTEGACPYCGKPLQCRANMKINGDASKVTLLRVQKPGT